MVCRLLLVAVGLSCFLFWACLETELQARERRVEGKVIVVKETNWHCDGWNGVKYPTEKSMKKGVEDL